MLFTSWSYVHLNALFVAPDQRRGGIGRALVEALREKAKELHLLGVLASVDASEFAALEDFIGKCGFAKLCDMPDVVQLISKV